jgi:glycolate oxidase FAD binding subunit
VVKNVAGFDLPKLACGSLGTLALIAVVTLRVHPLPEASVARVVRGLDAAGVVALASALRSAQLEPSALVARRTANAWEVALRFEGFGPAVEQQVARLEALAPGHASDDDGPASVFSRHQRAREDARLRVKLAALPNALPVVERALAALAKLHEGAELAWYPTLGLGFFSAVAVAGGDVAAAIGQARAELGAIGGSLTVEEAPASVRGVLATWSAPSALVLQRAVKARFDPAGLLAPGRFVEGL